MKNYSIPCLLACMFTAMLGIDADSVNQLHNYFVANYKHFGKEWQEALTWYKRTLQSGNAPFVYRGLIHLFHDTGNHQRIIQLQPVIEKHFNNDITMQFILAQSLARSGQEAFADQLLIKLNQQKKTHPEIAFHVLQRHMQKGEFDKALTVIDALLNNAIRKPTHFIFHFVKGQLLLQMDKKEEALASIKASLELQPNFEKGWLMHALIEEKMGKLDEAIKGYTNFLQLAGPNSEIEQHLLGLTFRAKLQESSQPSVTIPADCVSKALDLFKHKEYQKALRLLQECIGTQPGNHEAKTLKIQVLLALNDLDQALVDIESWVLTEPHIPVWFDALHLLYRDGSEASKIMRTLQRIEKALPQELLPKLYLADLSLRTQNIHAATSYLMRSLKIAESTDLQATLAFQLCALAYNNHHYKKIKDIYREYTAAAEHHAPFLNLMAYYYCSKENNLELAQQLIAKALKLDPKNPHLMDTQALIYYHQKQYDKAYAILEKIAQQEKADCTIAKHFAKTCYELGNITLAIKHLEHATDLIEPTNKKKKYKQLLSTWKQKI
ncbi:tetratricopeptide repeat protein [Candidatus Dependentiae bacterium]|nr:tetratricopeptide repeat protein [Candidatus Dependentiae bacterium]